MQENKLDTQGTIDTNGNTASDVIEAPEHDVNKDAEVSDVKKKAKLEVSESIKFDIKSISGKSAKTGGKVNTTSSFETKPGSGSENTPGEPMVRFVDKKLRARIILSVAIPIVVIAIIIGSAVVLMRAPADKTKEQILSGYSENSDDFETVAEYITEQDVYFSISRYNYQDKIQDKEVLKSCDTLFKKLEYNFIYRDNRTEGKYGNLQRCVFEIQGDKINQGMFYTTNPNYNKNLDIIDGNWCYFVN